MLRRLFTFALALLVGLGPATAQFRPGTVPGFRPGFQFSGLPGGFPSYGSVFDADWKNNRYSGPAISVSNASGGYIDDSAGNWTLVPPNTARRSDKGLLVEGAQTNDALYSRDLTQTTWTKTGATAAKTQSGFDGAANGASLLTATAANGSATQAITSSSSLRTTSVFLRRVTGLGVVQITQDNTNWTTCPVTASWSRCQVSATLANPTVGVRLATSGDAVAVDVVQDEPWNTGTTAVGGASSPIVTTATAATRAADVVTATLAANISPASVALVARQPSFQVKSGYLFTLSDGTANNRIAFRSANGTPTNLVAENLVSGGGSAPANITSGMPGDGTRHAYGYATAPNDQANSFDGSAVVTSTSATPAVFNTLHAGHLFGINQLFGYIERLAIYPYRTANSNLQQQSTLANWGG